MRTLFLSILAAAMVASISLAQTPMPVVVPAMTPATTNAKSPVTSAVTTASTHTTLKALQAIKAANDEILKQQAATLEKLDEMEKTAQEIRIYSKRG
jgi:hypothetical protein